MPKILDTAVKQIMADNKGMSKSKAYAIATASLKKAGDLDSKGNATAKGTARGKMTKAQRAKSRAKQKVSQQGAKPKKAKGKK